MTITIVVPCYNEADRLTAVASEFIEYSSANPAVKFLFVDDGSKDETLIVLERLCQELGGSGLLVPLEKNGGKALAVRAGMKRGVDIFEPTYIGFWDADLATPLGEISEFVKILDSSPQTLLVTGCRLGSLGRQIVRTPFRHYAGRFLATLIAVTLGLPVYDSQCGAKLFRVTDQFDELWAQEFCSNWLFDVEILARLAARSGIMKNRDSRVVYEQPLGAWSDVPGSKVKPQDFLIALVELYKIRRRYSKVLPIR